MRLERRFIAVCGIIFIGGTLLAGGPAGAFGQQWRPAQGYGPATNIPYRGGAEIPGFSPHGAARPAFARPSVRFRQHGYGRSVRSQMPRRTQPFAAPFGYPPAPHGVFPGRAYPVMPYAMTAPYPGAGWGRPIAPAMPPWRQPMPLVARQFAWRPAPQPWVAQRLPDPRVVRYRQPGYNIEMAPSRYGFRPTGRVGSPVMGAWRPTPPPVGVTARYPYRGQGPQRQAVVAGLQPLFRPGGPSYPAPRIAMPGRDAPPGAAGRAYWRPGPAVAAVQYRTASPFRPNRYGRTPLAKRVPGTRDVSGRHSAQVGLPGWVTTYQDSDFVDTCGWCSGS